MKRGLFRSDGARVVAVVLVYMAAVVWSAGAGAPVSEGRRELPGVALGWDVLLHVGRGAALLGTVGIVVLVGWRTLRGELPIKLGQVEYAEEAAAAGTRASEVQERRIRHLEVLAGIRSPDR